MTASACMILKLAHDAGIRLRADGGRILAAPRSAVNDSLRELIRTNKDAVLQALAGGVTDVTDVTRSIGDQGTEWRRQHVLMKLEAVPSRRYAVYVADASGDPVVVGVGLRRGQSCITFDLEIPASKYDGLALVELVQRWCT